MIQLTYWTKSC